MYDGDMRVERTDAIRAILERRAIATQETLRGLLRRRGMRVDQSTLSRDLAELGARKVGGRYRLLNGDGRVPAPLVDYAAAVRGFVPCGPHLIVVRTVIGQAQPVALAIDSKDDPSVLATLAGDDTVFVATRNRKTQAVALRRLTTWFGDQRER